MHRRLSGLVVASVLVLAGCGDDAAPVAVALDPTEVEAAAEALVTTHGAFDAFVAILAAFDMGHDVGQLVTAAVAGEVAVDGTLTTPDGDVVAPSGEPLGLFGDPPAGKAQATGVMLALGMVPVAQASPVDRYLTDVGAWASEIFDAGQAKVREMQQQEDAETVFHIRVLMLAAHGYGPEQILDGLISARFRLQGIGRCAYIAGEDGPVVPARASALRNPCPPIPGAPAPGATASDAFDEPEQATEAATSGPGGQAAGSDDTTRYVGSVVSDTGVDEVRNEAVLEVAADGTVTGMIAAEGYNAAILGGPSEDPECRTLFSMAGVVRNATLDPATGILQGEIALTAVDEDGECPAGEGFGVLFEDHVVPLNGERVGTTITASYALEEGGERVTFEVSAQ